VLRIEPADCAVVVNPRLTRKKRQEKIGRRAEESEERAVSERTKSRGRLRKELINL